MIGVIVVPRFQQFTYVFLPQNIDLYGSYVLNQRISVKDVVLSKYLGFIEATNAADRTHVCSSTTLTWPF